MKQIAVNLASIQIVVQRKDPKNHRISFKGAKWHTFDERTFKREQIAAMFETLSMNLRNIEENKLGIMIFDQDYHSITLCSRFCSAVEINQTQGSVTLRS